jgi:hypothetical protein
MDYATPAAPPDVDLSPVFYTSIGGTWSWSDDGGGQWWHPTSNFSLYLMAFRLFPLRPRRPFKWSGRVGGMQFWRRLFGRTDTADHLDWKAASVHLLDHLDHCDAPTPYEARNLLAHSYGGNVVFYACADGLKIRTLITFGTPVRADMLEVVRRARPNIGRWIHVIDEGDDKWNRRGNFGDGELEWPGRADQTWINPVTGKDLADKTDDVDGIEHSRVLNEQRLFHHVVDRGWVTFLRTGEIL